MKQAIVLAVVFVAGCSIGPDYKRPPAATPPAYKELQGWKIAEPRAATVSEEWWGVFGNDELRALEARLVVSNQNLASAEAQYRQARALVAGARAEFFPTVTVGASFTRTRFSATTRSSAVGSGRTLSEYSLPVDASWEPDLWGRVRRSVEAARAGEQASAADVAATRLSLQAELATDYFQLRTLDAQQVLLDSTVQDFERALQQTQNRYAQGVASRADVVQAQTQLETTRAQAIDVGVARAQTEHAIAVLVGTPPAELSLAAAPLVATPPAVPVGVPSELLERRPDVAAAERRVAQANAQIGVAEAAYYPTVVLSASGGFQTTRLADWFTWPSRFWSVGPSVSETVFDGGARGAQTEQARAVYDQTVAEYRQAVLGGFQEVEDDLAALGVLAREAEAEDAAVRAARESVTVATNQYKAGLIGYLDVVQVQATALADERTAVDLLGRRMSATVGLVKALGGGLAPREIVADPAERERAASAR